MLKTYKVHENMAVSADRLIEHAESMNAFYAEDPNRVSAKFTKATLDRAMDYGFYLGLDSRCSWLQALKP